MSKVKQVAFVLAIGGLIYGAMKWVAELIIRRELKI